MDKFNRTLRGYDPDEVNAFLDQVISQVEKMVNEIKVKDNLIAELSSKLDSCASLKEKVEQYARLEDTMNRAIFMAQKTADQMKFTAQREGELVLDDAKKNANRIINEALLKAEQTESEAQTLRRNINIFKRRLRALIEEQLNAVNDIDKIDL